MNRPIFMLSAALAVATVAALPSLTPSAALAKCNPGRTNDGNHYWLGWYRSPSSTPGGVYSSILNYSPWVYSGSAVRGWTMLNNGGSNWAQVDWWEYAGGTRYTFVQWTTSPNNWQTKFWNPQSTGSYTYYSTLYNNTPGDFTFQVAGSTIDQETASYTQNEAEIDGEIDTLADQMPGGYNSNAHEVFSDSNIYLNAAWQAFSGTVTNSNSTYFGNSNTSSTYDMAWDKACSS